MKKSEFEIILNHFQKKEFDLNRLAEKWLKESADGRLKPHQYATIKQGQTDIEGFKYLMNAINDLRNEVLDLNPCYDLKVGAMYKEMLNTERDFRDTILEQMYFQYENYSKSINNINENNSAYGNYLLSQSIQNSLFVTMIISELKKYAEITNKNTETPETF